MSAGTAVVASVRTFFEAGTTVMAVAASATYVKPIRQISKIAWNCLFIFCFLENLFL